MAERARENTSAPSKRVEVLHEGVKKEEKGRRNCTSWSYAAGEKFSRNPFTPG